jgi:DNA (cytosine-5)-methyltransferase 1
MELVDVLYGRDHDTPGGSLPTQRVDRFAPRIFSSGRVFTTVSTFSGAMGLDIGLEQTGRFRTLACIEHDPMCCETIRANRDAGRTADPELRIYEGDIVDINPYQVMDELGIESGALDLLVGGPPCQTFSTAGRRGTVQDVRGMLLWQFLRYVEAFRPKFWLMENVRGLISAAVRHRRLKERPERGGPPLEPDERPGSVVQTFLSDLREYAPEYRVDCFEVNAVNYGAPQLRERVLFIGNRMNHVVEFPAPTHGHQADGMQFSFFTAPSMLPYRTLGDAIRGLHEDDPVIMDFSPRKKKYLAMVKPGGNWRTLPVDVQKESMGAAWHAKGGRSGWWRRLSYDLPCPTIVTMPNHAGTAMCHPDEVRALTLRECALVQEFPLDWEFTGTAQQQYTQVGQAVPVRLGCVSGELLAAHLDAAHAEGLQRRSGEFDPFRLVYLQSHIRTRRWYKDGAEFTWSDGATNGHAKYAPPKTYRRTRTLA